ncbi:MAG: DUF4861 family protein [Planctomycetes bacterium]|nr:DUF4861 family protein [Planctomycetota bacterium]
MTLRPTGLTFVAGVLGIAGALAPRPIRADAGDVSAVTETLTRVADRAAAKSMPAASWDLGGALEACGLLAAREALDKPRYRDAATRWLDRGLEGGADAGIAAIGQVAPAAPLLGAAVGAGNGAVIEKYLRAADRALDFVFLGRKRRPDEMWRRLWVDDLAVVAPALSRMGEALLRRDPADERAWLYFDAAVGYYLSFCHLQDVDTDLFRHDPESASAREPVFWSRGNGYVLLAGAEILSRVPDADESRDPRARERNARKARVRESFIRLLKSFEHCLDRETWLFPNCLDYGRERGGARAMRSYLETSGGALFAFAAARAYNRGWFDPEADKPDSRLRRALAAFLGAAQQVLPEGEVFGVQGDAGRGGLADLQRAPRGEFPVGVGAMLLAGSEILTGKCRERLDAWKLPAPPPGAVRYTKRVIVTLENPSGTDLPDAWVVLPVKALRARAADFNPRNFFAAMDGREWPSQYDVVGAEGREEIVVSFDYQGRERKELRLYYHPDHDLPRWYPARVAAGLARRQTADAPDSPFVRLTADFADLSRRRADQNPYEHFGPWWESERAAFRVLLDRRNALEPLGKLTDAPAMRAARHSRTGFFDRPEDEVRTLLRIGDRRAGEGPVGPGALGLGTLAFLTPNGAIARDQTDLRESRVTVDAAGPVRTLVRLDAQGWWLGDGEAGSRCDVTSEFEMFAGHRFTRVRHRVAPRAALRVMVKAGQKFNLTDHDTLAIRLDSRGEPRQVRLVQPRVGASPREARTVEDIVASINAGVSAVTPVASLRPVPDRQDGAMWLEIASPVSGARQSAITLENAGERDAAATLLGLARTPFTRAADLPPLVTGFTELSRDLAVQQEPYRDHLWFYSYGPDDPDARSLGLAVIAHRRFLRDPQPTLPPAAFRQGSHLRVLATQEGETEYVVLAAWEREQERARGRFDDAEDGDAAASPDDQPVRSAAQFLSHIKQVVRRLAAPVAWSVK